MIETIDLLNPLTQVISVLLGIVVLLMGRRLFWLTIGAIGFVLGLTVVINYLALEPAWLRLVVALLAGGLGAILAIFVQQIAISIAGLFIGGYSLVWVVQQLAPGLDQWSWVAFIIGAILGILLATALFDIALIALSTVVGAILIVQVIDVGPQIKVLIFLVLVLIGVAIQANSRPSQRKQSRS